MDWIREQGKNRLAIPKTQKATEIVVALCAALILRHLIQIFLRDIRARSRGCLKAAVYPHKERILGLDTLRESLKANSEHRLLDLISSRFQRFGHTHYSLGLGQWVLWTDEPENIKACLATSFDDWPIAGPRLNSVVRQLGTKSVFSSNGEAWKMSRAMLRPAFVRDQISDFACFDRHIGNLLEKIPKNGETFDVQDLLFKMTMDSSTDFMLGYSTNTLVEPSPEAERFIAAFEKVSYETARRARLGTVAHHIPSLDLYRAVKVIQNYVDHYVSKAITERGKTHDRGHVFLDALIESGASAEYIRDQVLSIIIAGRDTTAAAMTAVFWYLARDPASVARLRREIEELGEPNPTWEQLRNLKYMSNTIKEALRLFPPVPTNARVAKQDTVLPRGGGPDGKDPVFVPKGTPCRWSLFSMQRRKDIYGDDADEFRPDRWTDLRVGWEYLPFHGGPRVCIGQQFALTQISYTLFKVLRQFQTIQAADDKVDELLIKTSTTASFAEGCWIRVAPADRPL